MKKLFAMILMLSILLTAAGCGKEEQRPTGTTAPGHTTETVAPTHASEATVPTQDTEATTPTQPSEETEPTEPDEPTEPTQDPELVTAYLLEDITMSGAGQTLNMELFYTERWQIEGLCGTFNGDMLLQLEVQYEEDGTPLYAVRYGAEGEEVAREEYTSVVDGRLMELVITEDGNSTHSVMTYDDSGLLLEKEDRDSDGKLINKIFYKYDEDGRVLSEVTKTPLGIVEERKEYRYDDQGLLSKFRWTMYGQTVAVFHYKYEDGKMIQRTCTDGELFSYKFHYDEFGNLDRISVGMKEEDGIVGVGTYRFHYKPVEVSQEEADRLCLEIGEFIEGIFYYA